MAAADENARNGATIHHLRRNTSAKKSCALLMAIFILDFACETGYRRWSPFYRQRLSLLGTVMPNADVLIFHSDTFLSRYKTRTIWRMEDLVRESALCRYRSMGARGQAKAPTDSAVAF